MTITEMEQKGVPYQKIYFAMALPLATSLVTMVIYNIADTWFVAATGNTSLIAGVSLGSPVLTLLMALGNIYGQGGSSPIARYIGQGNTKAVREVSSVCFYYAIITGVVVGAIMLLFQTPIVRLLGSSEETFEYARQYYHWLALGAPFIILSFVVTNLLRAEGLSKESMFGSVGGVVLNIILDPIFISVLGWGAAGAAIASVIGYIVTDAVCLYAMIRRSHLLSINPKDAGTSLSTVLQIFGIGVPAAITNIAQSLSLVLLNQFLLPYGDDKIAAMGISFKISMIVVLVLTGFSFGGLPLFGYYYGADRRKDFMTLTRFCMKFLCAIAIVLSAGVFVSAQILMRFFVSDAGLIADGSLMLRLTVITMVCAAVVLLMTLLFQSMGKVKEMFLLSISRQGVVFILTLFVMSNLFGYTGILISQAISDVISAVVAVGMYQHWKKEYLPER